MPRPKPSKFRLAGRIVKWLFYLGALGALLFFFILGYYSRQLPDPNKIIDRPIAESTKIYDRTGETLLYEVYQDERRTVIALDDLPVYVKQATIAVEDKDFYRHGALDFRGIARAIVVNLFHLGRVQGGSTLTQQLIKNSLLTREKTFSRKFKEWILAYQLENKFSKDEILQLYFNEIPYGSTVYGIESAARYYFNKPAKELTLDEAALLAALPKAPSYYSPHGTHRDQLVQRQKLILQLMQEQGYIDEATWKKAGAIETLKKLAARRENLLAPHFVMYVRDLLNQKYGEDVVTSGGLKVITSLDLDKQKLAEKIVAEQAEKNKKTYKAHNAALVSLDPKTGQVLALVGSKNYFGDPEPAGCSPGVNCLFEPNPNVALRLRQPGSSIKPIVYTAAFMKGYTPSTLLWDTITTFKNIPKDYTPQNYDGREHGLVTMKKALAGSLNIPAVKTVYLTGVDRVLDLTERLDYTSLFDRSRFSFSIVLGGAEVKLLEHTAAFGILANEGLKQPVSPFLRVENKKGELLEEWGAGPGEQVIEPEIARLTSSILSDNEARTYIFGARNYLILPDRPVAAKTGTTNDYRDGWTMGYTPSLVTGVWVGNNDNSPMKGKADGSAIAAPIWQRFMSEALKNTPVEQFTPPQPVATSKPILDGSDQGGMMVTLDRASGKLATALTPPSFQEQRRFTPVHSILFYVNKDDPRGPTPSNPADDPQFENWEKAVQAYATAHGIVGGVEPPHEFDDLHVPQNQPSVRILSPGDNATVSGFLNAVVEASAPRGVSRVEYWIDERPFATQNYAPYFLNQSLPADLSGGVHKLVVKAFDDIDNLGQAEINVNVVK